MELDNKYYTPAIEEFHVGFECESNYVLANAYEKDSSKFVPFTFTEDNFAYMVDAYTNDAYPSEFRVKCLDKEDIESFGFKCFEEQDGSYKFSQPWYNESNLVLHYYIWSTGSKDSDEVTEHRKIHIYQTKGVPIIYRHDGVEDKIEVDRNIFLGTIKNKSELKVLLKQLGIDENN